MLEEKRPSSLVFPKKDERAYLEGKRLAEVRVSSKKLRLDRAGGKKKKKQLSSNGARREGEGDCMLAKSAAVINPKANELSF